MRPPNRPTGNSDEAVFHQRLLDFCVANQPLEGRGYKLKRTAQGFFLEIEPGGKGGGIASDDLVLGAVAADDDGSPFERANYFWINQWDDDLGDFNEDLALRVAKPYLLRNQVTSRVIGGVTFNFSYAYDGTRHVWVRTTTASGYDTQTHIIGQPYLVGDWIWASKVPYTGLVDEDLPGEEIFYKDNNDDAREWTEVPVTPPP